MIRSMKCHRCPWDSDGYGAETMHDHMVLMLMHTLDHIVDELELIARR